MEAYADLELVGYLFNDCYGGFSFSENFVERINAIREKAGLKPVTKYYDDRTDPEVISLFQEMGSKEASGRHAQLVLDWVPKEFLPYTSISEYDGQENVCIPPEEIYADVLKQFLSEWEKDSTLGVEELNRRYKRIKDKYARYQEFMRNLYYKKENSD